ncbi:MAG: LytTR family DNA-binding domain-containing protein [Flavobacteriaceae bacterium]|nr:LytTR family DNA-binding domain-containing protein [Flavobacteriaceae bacterium]
MYKVLIIDDEKDALEALEWKLKTYIKEVDVTLCNSPIKALTLINEIKPDIVFLDIHMPEMDGFTFLDKLSHRNFNLIFTTAHNEFAIKAFKVSAVDYLLKPVDKDELIAAVEKVKLTTEVPKEENILENKLQMLLNNLSTGGANTEKIHISADGKVYLLEKEEVVMMEADKSYTTIYLNNGQEIVVSKTLKEVEKSFQFPRFYRVHNSYLINLDHVKEYLKGLGGELIMSNGKTASISRSKKAELFQKLYLD